MSIGGWAGDVQVVRIVLAVVVMSCIALLQNLPVRSQTQPAETESAFSADDVVAATVENVSQA